MSDAPTHSKIVFLGAGNLATSLAVALHGAGHTIAQVYSRTEQSAQTLAQRVAAAAINHIEQVDTQADLFVYALPDSVLPQIISKMPPCNGLHVHTAGSMPMAIFAEKQQHFGVFYPFQSFNKQRIADFEAIPIFIEANSLQSVDYLRVIANSITTKVYELSSEDRQILHLSGVFANNFTNCMYQIAEELLAAKQVPFSVLLPLINESVAKLQTLSPRVAQTGPAVRRDENVIAKHLEMLREHAEWQQLYRALTNTIQELCPDTSGQKNVEI